MVMKRAIVVIRTSTSRQEIEAQTREIVEYARSYGYSDDEIEIVGERGASAIKLDAAYMKNLNIIYNLIENNPIEVVFAWALDRIGRDELTMFSLKNFLIEHKVQLRIKNPTLYLLNENGTVNSGMELAINMFITIAKQEMENKKVRFERAKKDYAAKGKFIGARYMMFGYTTNDDGYLVTNKETAPIVRLIFDMYCTEKYSSLAIARELNERGFKINKRNFNEGNVVNILKNTAYIGHLERNSLVKDYPRIISDEQFEQVKKIRNSRNSNLGKQTKHISLALKILKCWECGSNYMRYQSSTDIRYVCYKRQQGRRYEKNERCPDSCYVQVAPMDELLQDLAYDLKHKYNDALSETAKKEMKERLVVLEQKIDNTSAEIDKIKGKFAKAYDAWESEILDKKQYDSRIEKLKAEKDNLILSLTTYQNEHRNIKETLSRTDRKPTLDEYIDKLVKDEIDNTEEEDKTVVKGVIDKFIKRAYAKAIKVNNTALTVIMVADYNNNIYNYIFQQKHGKKEGLFTYSLEGNKLEAYPHKVLFATVKGKVVLDRHNTGVGNAMLAIINSPENMANLHIQVEELNTKMKDKINY